MPVDTADTRNRIGRSALFHRGNPWHTPSRQPDVNGDAQAHDEPHAIEPHRHLALHQIKHQHDERDDHEHRQNTTPQVITDPKFVSRSAKRSG